MVKAHILGQKKANNTLVIMLTENEMDKVCRLGLMERSMKASGKTVKSMAKECFL